MNPFVLAGIAVVVIVLLVIGGLMVMSGRLSRDEESQWIAEEIMRREG